MTSRARAPQVHATIEDEEAPRTNGYAVTKTVTVPLPFARMHGGVLLYGHKWLISRRIEINTQVLNSIRKSGPFKIRE